MYLKKICKKTLTSDIFYLSVLEILKCFDSFKRPKSEKRMFNWLRWIWATHLIYILINWKTVCSYIILFPPSNFLTCFNHNIIQIRAVIMPSFCYLDVLPETLTIFFASCCPNSSRDGKLLFPFFRGNCFSYDFPFKLC